MPVARFQLPDGRVARFEVPEGTTPEQAQTMIQTQLSSMVQPSTPALPAALQPRPEPAIPGPRQAAPAPAEERKMGLFDMLSIPFEMGAQLAQKPRAEQAAVVAPAIEALGAAGGATVGSMGGPAGTVAGAGLGYAAGKELNRMLAGNAPKETLPEATVRVAGNALEGATFEAGGQAVAPYLSKAIGKVMDMRQIPKQKAAELARNALGADPEQTVNALRNAPQNASVAEITAKIQNPTWQALVRDSLERSPSGIQYLNKFRTMSDQEAVNALSKLTGGKTAAEARGVTENMKTALNAVTGPEREAALKRANLGKYVANETAAREANDLAVLTGSGQKIDPERFATQAKDAEAALRSFGIKPLEGAPLAQRVQSIVTDPEFAANDVMKASVDNLARDIAQWTNQGGVIDARALDAIRKNSVNAAVRDLLKGQDPSVQREAAASVMSRIKPMLINAIEDAGGTGYRQYLENYTKGMQRIAEKKLTGEALRLWKTDKDAFVRLVQNESPETVEKFLGKGNYNIATELSDNTMDVLQKQAEKRLNQLASDKQATEGQQALTTLVRQNTSHFRLPSWLSFWGAAANKTIGELEKAVGNKTMKVLAEAMQSPQGAANLLDTLPANERNRVLKLISDPSSWKVKGIPAAAGTQVRNALAPDEQNQNALAE